ncbi:MAG: hypothetical protein J1F42_14070 [Lachnospiraceae bacterium]|nr:hypothetical protein [Lachnospiraceae bacterium]
MGIIPGSVGAAKAAMRAAINAEIQKLQKKIRKAKDVKQKIKLVQLHIDADISTWNRSLGTFESSQMAPVKVTDKFEGDSAETISTKIPEPIDIMRENTSGAQEVQGEADIQIEKLDVYIETLEQQIEALRAQLAAI